MITQVIDRTDLLVVSPEALATYACAEGWTKTEDFGLHSDVYAGDGLPEIIVPQTRDIGDYQRVVAQLIEIFARTADMEELEVYHDLVTADRDIIRVQVDGEEQTVGLSQGADLIAGAQDMLLATASSLHDPKPPHQAAAHQEAADLAAQVRLGHPGAGSFGIILLLPVMAAPMQKSLLSDLQDADSPMARWMTRRLCDALSATKQAVESTASGDAEAFAAAVAAGASANLFDALAKMVKPFPSLDIRVTWAKTRPMPEARYTVRFTQDDAPILDEAARVFRNRGPKLDVRLLCVVSELKRCDGEKGGTVTLRTIIEDRIQSVSAVLSPADYDQAFDALKHHEPIMVKGTLGQSGQGWHLQNPSIVAGHCGCS